ncbi:TlpA disulfide reductase family protein [Pelagibius sp. CAU 1746]|uniref:TlpA disulfide reductase family protein n=1 Tax=Pelagibius sp. CAU 1746 TaxID=3140370 RepID=UPI00325AE5C0
MIVQFGVTERTFAAVRLAALAFVLWIPVASAPIASEQERLAESGGAPTVPEGPFAEDFTFSDPPVPAPSAVFQALEGGETSFADFRGKVVLVNFWATWCAPCVREMPSLERLHQALAGEGFTVLAVSQDRGGAGVVAPFLARLDLQRLPVYLDPKGKLARAFALKGLPTSFVIDRQGRVVAGLVGPAEWDSPQSLAFMRHYLGQAGPGQPGAEQAPAAMPQDTRQPLPQTNTPG